MKFNAVIVEKPTTYKILSSIHLSRFALYSDKIIENHQYGFQHNRVTVDQIFCSHQIMETKWEYSGTVHQLLINFKKAYDSARKELLYNIFIELCMPSKLIRLVKIC
jgi:hypothetical protein